MNLNKEVDGEYVPRNWQNFGRLLEPEEISDIRRRIAGLHFAKDMLSPTALGALYAAEALLREVELRRIQQFEASVTEGKDKEITGEPWLDNPETD